MNRSFRFLNFAATFLCAFALVPGLVNAQNIAINTSGTAAASTNMLEVTQSSTAAYMVALYAINSGANAATDTGYAFKAIKTGATGNNVAGYFSATGGGANYASSDAIAPYEVTLGGYMYINAQGIQTRCSSA